jgi:uncharacterized protein YcgL (UPF0745 family)
MAKTTTCHIYRSSKKEELYLFLANEDDFDCVPPEVMQGFGRPQKAMVLELSPDSKMARSKPAEVLANLKSRGFHLQLPPAPHERVDAQMAREKP